MKKFFEEFKAFAMRGNVLDMAVGVVIGGAFGKITNSVVNDIIMPLISMLTGGIDFSAWKWVLKEAVMEGSKVVTPEVAVNYGNLIAVILDFIIIAFLENNLQADGSVLIPKVLQPYMGGKTVLIPKK